jgi:cytochrome b
VFHWSLLVAVVTLFVTGNVGGNWLVWHMRAGYAVGTLLLFRLAWGVVGGRWSRFASFVPPPGRVWAHLSGSPHQVGHNPLGALSVLAMLLVLTAQVASGLVADDEIAFTGPLYRFVSGETSGLATWYHTGVGKIALLVLVALHVGAIAYYRLAKQQTLVKTMLTGDQAASEPLPPPSADTAATRALALVLALAFALLMAWVASLGMG